jgi:hypothetical protein
VHISKVVPETDTLIQDDIEKLLTQTIPHLPWDDIPIYGTLYQAALTAHTKFYADELYKRYNSFCFSQSFFNFIFQDFKKLQQTIQIKNPLPIKYGSLLVCNNVIDILLEVLWN